MSSGDGGRPPRTAFKYSGMSARDEGVPWAIRRTAVFMERLGARLLVHVARRSLDVFNRRHWQDSVTEVEDVAWTPAGALQHVVNRLEDAFDRREQDRRIEVALHRAVVADAFPRLVNRRAPVGADDVAARVPNLAQDRAGTDAEMNRRHAEILDAVEDAL